MAQIVITNAKVYTVDNKCPWAEGIAIDRDQITAVGTNDEVQALIHESTTVIDAEGRLILPGFIDSHCHPVAYTYTTGTMDMFQCTSKEAYQAKLKEYADTNRDKPVFKGAGWFYADFPEGAPHKKILDEVVSDRPVMIYSGDFHSLWVNSKALEAAGITDTTENPHGGEFARDDKGQLTGYINESPAVRIIEERISGFSAEDIKKGIKRFMQDANSVGITSIGDAGVLMENGLDGYRTMKKSDYSTRVYSGMIVNENAPLTHLEKLAAYRDIENSFYHCNGVKLFMDGVPEANTAVMEEEYLNEPGNSGVPLWDVDKFNAFCREADKRQLQIHVHAIGDRAARLTLDAFEAAETANGKRDSRHMIAHLQQLKNDQLPRMERLGVIAVPTASWFEKSDMYHQVELFNLGKERADENYKMKAFFDHGITVACGSDAPVGIGVPVTSVAFAPALAIQMGITRCSVTLDARKEENVLNPKERVSLEQMIEAYTIGGARACFAEDEIGSIEAGKKADLIILNQNLFEIPVSEIYQTKVDMTIFNGTIVYKEEKDET